MAEKNANLWSWFLQNRLIVRGTLTVAVAAIGTVWCIYARGAAYDEAMQPYSGRARGTIINETVSNTVIITTKWTSSGGSTVGVDSEEYLEAEYEYSVDGHVYKRSGGYWHELTTDGTITVYYDPKDPGNSMLNRGLHEVGDWAAQRYPHPFGIVLFAGLPGFVAIAWGVSQINEAGAFNRWHGTRLEALPRLACGSALLSLVPLLFYVLIILVLSDRLSQGDYIGTRQLLLVYFASWTGLLLISLARLPHSRKV